jgi:hypothetical protein
VHVNGLTGAIEGRLRELTLRSPVQAEVLDDLAIPPPNDVHAGA